MYADEVNHPKLQYKLGDDPIKITLVIKNESHWSINTEKGFSQVDLHNFLILTGPNGTKHTLNKDDAQVLDVLPAISLNQVPVTEAEILPADVVSDDQHHVRGLGEGAVAAARHEEDRAARRHAQPLHGAAGLASLRGEALPRPPMST